MPHVQMVEVVEAAEVKRQLPLTSQSPAVREMDDPFAAVPLVSGTDERSEGVGNSPTLPALALSFVVVPTMPAVDDGVIAPVNVRAPTLEPNAGSEPVAPTSTCPVVPTASWVIAAVPSPTNTPCVVSVVRPLPP